MPWRSLPWNAGEAEMQRNLERRDLMPPTQKPASRFGTGRSDDDDDTSSPVVRPTHTRPYISSRQQQGVLIALRYAQKYHTSPEDAARKEFESALRETLRLRDLMHLRYVKPSVPGDSVLISGGLHQETGGMVSRPDHYLPAGDEQEVDPLGSVRRDSTAPLIR